MTDSLDLVVAGGGPVGLMTAMFAARAGFRVTVVEPRSEPIDKACGEGLMPTALSLLHQLDVDPAGQSFDGIIYADSLGRRKARAFFGAGSGRGVRRLVLHEELSRRAKELGVDHRVGKVSKVSESTHGVLSVLSDGETLRSTYLAAADGLHSTLRSGLGLSAPPSKHPRYGLRQHFALAPWTTAVEVYWAAHSEAYVTPVDSQVVGVALLVDRVGGDFEQRLGEFPALLQRLDGAQRIGSVLGAGPLRQVARRRVQGRIALVGDAAGYVDALTGEGLAIGFESARALIEAMLAEDLTAYERSWRRITRRYRVLTLGLLAASRNPWIRDRIVPASARLPRVFGAAVNSLA